MRMQQVMGGVAAAGMLFGGVHAVEASTQSAIANQYGTIMNSGPRIAPNGNRFLNAEGSGNNASDGYFRFDLTSAKAAFDAEFGAGGWQIDDITISLTQSNASFSTGGGVTMYYFSDDNVAITNGANDGAAGTPNGGDFGGLPVSTLTFGDYAGLAGLDPVLNYTFSVVSTGTVDSYSAANGLDIATLASDILSNNILSLVLVADAGTVATYKGNEFNGALPPQISITASEAPVPEPASLALLAASGLLIARRRSR